MEYVEIARAESERGELVLRERRPEDGPASLELRVNGVFVMDTVEVSTERALARDGARAGGRPAGRAGRRAGARVHDARGARRPPGRAAARSSRSSRRWSTGCATAPSRTVRRCSPTSGSTSWSPTSRSRGGGLPATYDLVLLDVDNGPDYLVHDDNAALYEPAGSPPQRGACCGRAARWWSGRPTRPPSSRRALREVFGDVEAPCRTRCGSRSGTSTTGSTSRGLPSRLSDVSDRGRLPHRARQHGRGPGARGRAVAGPDPAGGRELPDQRHPDRAAR